MDDKSIPLKYPMIITLLIIIRFSVLTLIFMSLLLIPIALNMPISFYCSRTLLLIDKVVCINTNIPQSIFIELIRCLINKNGIYKSSSKDKESKTSISLSLIDD